MSRPAGGDGFSIVFILKLRVGARIPPPSWTPWVGSRWSRCKEAYNQIARDVRADIKSRLRSQPN
jgi:hypothetical protein